MVRMEMTTYHLFLWPRNAQGRPVRMRRAPSTPNPGSRTVSSLTGAGLADTDTVEEVVVEVVDDEAWREVEIVVGTNTVDTTVDPREMKVVGRAMEDVIVVF